MKHTVEYDGTLYHVTAHIKASGFGADGVATIYARAETRDMAVFKAVERLDALIAELKDKSQALEEL